MFPLWFSSGAQGQQRWYALARYIADKILAFVPNTPIPAAVATG
jgi:hypothetical protein